MNTHNATDLWLDGLWRENPGMVKLLGLCPLLAISSSVVNGLGLGIASIFTLAVSNTAVSALRHRIPKHTRIPLYVLIIASTVTIIELLAQAYTPTLHRSLGIFLPLIVTNCLILGRVEAFAQRQPLRLAIHDALAMGCGFTAVLVSLGAIRELIGSGTLFTGMDALLGPLASTWTLQLFPEQHGVLLAVLPPGAFIALGLLLALRAAMVKH